MLKLSQINEGLWNKGLNRKSNNNLRKEDDKFDIKNTKLTDNIPDSLLELLYDIAKFYSENPQTKYTFDDIKMNITIEEKNIINDYLYEHQNKEIAKDELIDELICLIDLIKLRGAYY